MSDVTQQIYEQTLVLRSQLDDEAAFRELLELHGPPVLAFIRRMMQSAPDRVDDLAQEIWVAIYRSLPKLEDAGKFRPWAFRIARDRIYREYRRRRIAIDCAEDGELENLPAIAEVLPAIEIEALQRGLDVISPQHREVLILSFFQEMSYEEIARVTGSTLGTVRSRIHYAKRALKNALERNPL